VKIDCRCPAPVDRHDRVNGARSRESLMPFWSWSFSGRYTALNTDRHLLSAGSCRVAVSLIDDDFCKGPAGETAGPGRLAGAMLRPWRRRLGRPHAGGCSARRRAAALASVAGSWSPGRGRDTAGRVDLSCDEQPGRSGPSESPVPVLLHFLSQCGGIFSDRSDVVF